MLYHLALRFEHERVSQAACEWGEVDPNRRCDMVVRAKIVISQK